MRFLKYIFMKGFILGALSFSYVAASLVTEEFEVEAFDYSRTGFKIPGRIMFYGEDSQEKPTFFVCHGGPCGSVREFGDISSQEEQARFLGVNVVIFDYRGSVMHADVYAVVAQEYYRHDDLKARFLASVNNDYGIGPMEDLRSVLHYVKATYSAKINPEKFFVGGHSYGGYMAILAALDLNLQREFCGMIATSSFYTLGDHGDANCPIFEADTPEIRARKEIARNPLGYTENINKPLLVIHGGEADQTTLVNRQHTERFIANAEEQGKNLLVTCHFIDEMGHKNIAPYKRALSEIVRQFIATHS